MCFDRFCQHIEKRRSLRYWTCKSWSYWGPRWGSFAQVCHFVLNLVIEPYPAIFPFILLVLSMPTLVYDRKQYFGTKPKPKLADTFSRYRNWYWNFNYISDVFWSIIWQLVCCCFMSFQVVLTLIERNNLVE